MSRDAHLAMTVSTKFEVDTTIRCLVIAFPYGKKHRPVCGPPPAATAVPLLAADVGPTTGMADGPTPVRRRRPAAGKSATGRHRFVVVFYRLFYRAVKLISYRPILDVHLPSRRR